MIAAILSIATLAVTVATIVVLACCRVAGRYDDDMTDMAERDLAPEPIRLRDMDGRDD